MEDKEDIRWIQRFNNYRRALRKLSRAVEIVTDLLLPYEFDISLFSALKNENLIDHINRVGVVIFQRVAEITDLQKNCKFGE